ncbi:hypothetical protein PHYSODRAFT_336739 [Phytophthora sojae]|uniref:Reverse transcriptase zinc-binding domain-containing protein n=1 Tax=Phytophthora sojae (strain P6497) TaxID=1094619 RepID=G4ZVW6_PHYSP|nr:hypothetical protein PHYSODRAFT_336739 [Phytophthora sojae]EGZ12302.1 hypothetical protein PHYSODRAFT_336739 [Phytophthora sojae]|eukprot:XP_009532635.1 hypothetical protein PHYSODRAFT_336739 [Phytophthora sojae]
MRVFQRLSVVIHAITTSSGGLLVVLQRPDSVAGLLGVTTQSRVRFFPHLRKQDWTALLRPPTSAWESRAKRLHCEVSALNGHSNRLALVKRWMLPTYDIQFRVLHELMHVNIKRFFLQTGRRDPTTCPRQDCYQRESLAHCFWLCSPTQQTWSALRPIWSPLLRCTPSWLGFLLGTSELLHSSWAAHHKLAYGLWLILRGICMRSTWINRTNDAFGREAASPKAIAAGVKSSFVVHLRSLDRRRHRIKVDTATMYSFIQHLVSGPEDDEPLR